MAKLRSRLETLAMFPDLGAKRFGFPAGTKAISFNRRTMVVYRVEADRVLILRVFHNGQDASVAPEVA
jgi:toxin ParE1/3/4